MAHRAASRPIVSLAPDDAVNRVASSQAQCVHINGFIGTLTADHLFNSFKLTDTSYSSSSFERSPWSQQLRHDFTVAKVIVFVGYSAYDLDIKRILLEKDSLRAKTIFCVGDSPTALTRRRLAKFGSVLNLDTASLANEIEAESQVYQPSAPTVPIGRVVYENAPPQAAGIPTDGDISDLLLWGKARYGLVWGSVNEPEPRYVVPRAQLEKAIQLLEDGSRNLVVRADLGNGKTVFLDSLDCQARTFGYRVLRVDTLADDFEEELEAAARAATKTLLLLDSYTNKRPALEIIARHRSPDLYLVCAARSIRHDVCFRWLYRVLGTSEIPELDVDILTAQEREWFRETMDSRGLWGKHAGLSAERKDRVLEKDCNSRVSQILLEILTSPAISERLSTVVKSISANRENAEIIAGILMLSLLDYSPSLDLVADLLGTETLNQAGFQRNEEIRELIDLRYDRVGVRSNVVAQHILKELLDPNICLAALKRLATRADDLSAKDIYFSILKDLMRSANVHRILPNQPAIVIRYYEHLQGLSRAKKNTNFWLQWAIAYMTMKRFTEAHIKLQTAYSIGGSRYDTFMLDTSHARLLLEEASEHPRSNRDDAISVFRKARRLLNPIISDKETMHQPFRVASDYRRFFDVHAALLSPSDREEVGKAAGFVLSRIRSLPSERQAQRYVAKCQDDMSYLVSNCGSGVPSESS